MQHFNKMFLLLAAVIMVAACKKENYAELDKGSTPLAISSTKTSVQLSEKANNEEAVTLTWTSGTNKGTNASIDYTLQLDKQGSNFANPLSLDFGKGVFSKKYTVGELNILLLAQLHATPGAAYKLEARIIAKVASAAAEPQISAPVSIDIHTYQPVSATLYLVGDASPNGWDNSKPTPLEAITTEAGAFTYSGQLRSGNFKFLAAPGSWLPSYNKGSNDSTLAYRTEDSQPDVQFIISTTGIYHLKVNLIDLTISIQKGSEPAYKHLWIVGDATPNGWNIDNPNEMNVDNSNPFVFKYHEILKTGEFKIPVSTGNWGTDFYMPAKNHPALTEQAANLVPGGSPDNKWQITTAGAYKISLDIGTNQISIKPFTPYTKLWMVGDATPVGWNIDNPAPMVAVTGDPFTFTWQGALKAGEFKIPTATGNWGTDYFMPLFDQQGTASNLAKFVSSGNPDHKWRISEPGNYKITLNQLKETIIIQKL